MSAARVFHYFLHRLWGDLVGLSLFRYVTFRAAGAAATAFVAALLFGRPFIRWLVAQGLAENTESKPSLRLGELHRAKHRTPTMGGVMILVAVAVSTVLWARLDEPFVLIALFALLSSGLVGVLDDRVKLRRRGKGISAREKLVLLSWIGGLVAVLLWLSQAHRGADFGTVMVPFAKGVGISLGMGYLPFVGLVLVGTANAVNLTDGLDGIAIGCSIFVAATFACLAYATGRPDFSEYLFVTHVPGGEELAVFASALVGAGLGFLWFNCHPAEVFMGDTGSLSLGASLGTIAVAIRQEALLVLVGGVFVAEAVSVILQVASFRFSGKRLLLCAPLHHHYEFKGWRETKITTRFWIVGAVLAVLGLASLKVR